MSTRLTSENSTTIFDIIQNQLEIKILAGDEVEFSKYLSDITKLIGPENRDSVVNRAVRKLILKDCISSDSHKDGSNF